MKELHWVSNLTVHSFRGSKTQLIEIQRQTANTNDTSSKKYSHAGFLTVAQPQSDKHFTPTTFRRHRHHLAHLTEGLLACVNTGA